MVLALLSFPIIYFMWKADNTCDTRIIMKDGTEYVAERVFHETTGMTWLKDCSGNEKRFPTVDIKTIEQINR